MNSTKPTFFNETVTISKKEYDDLLEYKAICKDILNRFRGDIDGL